MKQLSKAGLSVNRVGVFNTPKLGEVYEIVLDDCLSDDEFNKLYTYLIHNYNYFPVQIREKSNIVIRLFPVKRSGSSIKKKILFIVTLTTIFLTGYGLSDRFLKLLNQYDFFTAIFWGLIYTVLFIAALGLHEFGHMKASRSSGMVIEGPYFIPAPPIQLGFIGTLGAIISMKSLPPDKKSLAKLGLSGPLTGYLVGLIIGIIGVFLSPLISTEKVVELIESGEVSEVSFLPTTIILLMLLRKVPSGYTILMHPLLFLAFVVFLVTFLNLLPIGQLDGGHVVRSYVSIKTYELLGYIVIITLASVGLLFSFINTMIGSYYMFLSIVLIILKLLLGRTPHVGAANQCSKIKDYRYLIVYIVLLILTLPIPT